MSDAPGHRSVATRAARAAERRRRRIIGLAVVASVVVAVGTYAFATSGNDDVLSNARDPDPTPKVSTASTLALQVSGTRAPMLAVVGRGTEALAMPYPQDLTIVVPGRGETAAAGVAGLTGASMRVALSNMSGTWLAHYGVIPVKALAAAVERSGGLEVTLTASYPTKTGSIGPGPLTLSGPQLSAFLVDTTDDAGTRWEIALKALLEGPIELEGSDFGGSDDAAAAAEVFAQAGGADIETLPTELITDGISVPAYPQLDEMMNQLFATAAPAPVIVQNGNGAPGVGEAVAAKIIPAGFRVTLSQNAQSFDVATTEVFANGVANEAAATRARQAMGVGRVRVSQVPSGIGDITIIVGKDFTVDGT